MSKISDVQAVLGVTADGAWGPKSQAALDAAKLEAVPTKKYASSFADPKDVVAFRRCKANGGSDRECFAKGDNGIGCWGDDVTTDTTACAVPPDDMIEKWGTINAAHNKQVVCRANGKEVTCFVRDRMPWKKNITNGAIIDLNPGAAKVLGLTPPFLVPAEWNWVETV